MLIKAIQLMISKIGPVSKVPSSSAVVIAPIVTFSREIDPLWMAELVAHKIKVTIVAETKCY